MPSLVGRRRLWALGTVAVTVSPIVLAAATAPSGAAPPLRALTWLLFVGSSVHVAATGWFYTVPEVRAHMMRHRSRYVWAPAALVAGLSVAAIAASARQIALLLLGFFAWQFFHFQKQNLGLAALAARAHGGGSLTALERRALLLTGIGGVLGLIGHPALLQLAHLSRFEGLFAAGFGCFVLGGLCGGYAMFRRAPTSRPSPFVTVYLVSLLFFLPLWIFSSPYAAVAGLTIAHGLQYLLLVGFVAAAPGQRQPVHIGLLLLVNVALLLGLALNHMSHLHDGAPLGRALFGVYLGLSTAHFVIDAGLWRLRDEFPRAFLTRRLPFLLAPERV